MKLSACLFGICMILLVGLAGAEMLSVGGPYAVGETLLLSGDTNYNTDNQILIEVYPASFGPTDKYEPSMAGGGSIVVPVVRNDGGSYSWSAQMNTAGWRPDQYMVRIEVIGKDYRETALVMITETRTPSEPLAENRSVTADNPVGLPPVQEPVSTRQAPAAPDAETQKSDDLSLTPAPVQTTAKQSPVSTGCILVTLLVSILIFAKKRD